MARLSNSNVLDQIAKFFLLLSEAPSYWTQPQYQLLIVASTSVVLIVVNSIQDDAPHNTPAVDCCVCHRPWLYGGKHSSLKAANR
jgi:hypothetical protein